MHFKLGHMLFIKLQDLARKGHLPKCIADCKPPLCASYRYGAAIKTPVGKSTHSHAIEREGGAGHIKTGDLRPGQHVSIDLYES